MERGGIQVEPVSHTFFLYNTICSVSIFDERSDAWELGNEVKKIASEVRRMLDFYDPESELGRLNREHRTGVLIKVSDELCKFMAEVLEFSKVSEGCYDPTVGTVVKLWNIPTHHPCVPAKEKIEELLRHTGASFIRCNLEERTIQFERQGMLFDAGGAGKGYAVQKVVEYLKSQGVKSATVNFGGNLYVIGKKTDKSGEETPWKIGVQMPWAEYAQSIGVLYGADCGIATSGGYDRFFVEQGKVYHHLIDPRCGYPAENDLDSVTIVSKNAFYTDLLSTACFIAGTEAKIATICSRVDQEAGYIIVKKNGSVVVSKNIENRFECQSVKGEDD